jgi:hypothetical protein
MSTSNPLDGKYGGDKPPHVVFAAQHPDKVFEHEWISWGRQDQFMLNIAW